MAYKTIIGKKKRYKGVIYRIVKDKPLFSKELAPRVQILDKYSNVTENTSYFENEKEAERQTKKEINETYFKTGTYNGIPYRVIKRHIPLVGDSYAVEVLGGVDEEAEWKFAGRTDHPKSNSVAIVQKYLKTGEISSNDL